MNKKYLLVLLSFSILSCSIVTNTNEVKKSNVISLSNNNHTIKVSDKKGANITAKIKIPTSFSIKTNANGSKIVKATDIKSIKVYLLQTNTATIAAGSDPLNATNIIYQSTIDVIPTNDIAINFTNVGGSTASFGTGNYYHIAIRAFDTIGGAGTELILPNNGSGSAWTGTTLTTPNTAVSLSGIQVLTTNLAVSQVNNLDIILNLKGKVPVLDTYIKITDGSPFRVKSYSVNFCTDPTKPDATKVLTSPIIINANTDSMVSSFTHRFELYSLTTAGTYYLTLQAYDNDFNNGNSFVRADNESATAYLAPDANKTIAVSTNSVTLDANLNFTFSSLSYFNVNANLSYFINTIAGTGTASTTPTLANGDGAAATLATLKFPQGVSIDLSGNVYIADTLNNKIRKITASTGNITTIAGTGTAGATGDTGLATSAQLSFPRGVAVDSSGNVYIADASNNKIRKITASTGNITTIAGTGTAGATGDGGVATSATLNNPQAVSIDSSGNVYIADTSNNKIRKITASTGNITTIAGTGTPGPNGDGGLATSATLNSPYGVTVDSSGNVYIADFGNHKITKITASTGIINTIAGTGTSGANGDGGLATSATLNSPRGVSVDSSGNVYIADTSNNKIRKITASTGNISTIAGTGIFGSAGDGGVATSAQLSFPRGVSIDSSGNVYIADTNNHKIRKLN